MVRKLVASEWISLDGVFDADTMDTWFHPFESPERGAYLKQNIDGSDGFVLGRTTYEMLGSYWPKMKHNEYGIADRLNRLPKYVVSTTLKSGAWAPATILGGDVVEEVRRLKREPGQDLLTFGSATLVRSLAAAGLVDEYRFLVHPVMAGRGKRFFAEGAPAAKLQLVRTKTFPSGVILLCYEPA
jgi:dihydrofolate reductase